MKYSKIKEVLRLEDPKHEQNGLAYLTHYFQNANNGAKRYFEKGAKKYLLNLPVGGPAEPNLGPYLPIKWDVPFPPPENPKFKFIDLFAGIGGIRMAFQNLGGKCVFTSEWNNFASKTYCKNFGEYPFGDITKIPVELIPNHDLLTGGFPCQPFSIAGVSKKNSLGRAHGFKDETQGTLFFDIARIIEGKRPKAFLLENVKNLTTHDKHHTFEVIHNCLSALDYSVHFKVLDGKYFVPQHRERIIIVGFDNRVFGSDKKFNFPKMPKTIRAFREILEDTPDKKFTLTDNLWKYLQNYARKHKEKGNGFGFGLTNLDGISRTLSARYYKDGSEILIPQKGENPRRLTPRECARLQGFPDKFAIPVSDTQAYKQFGNSVVVPLIQAVGKKLIQAMTSKNGPASNKADIS